MNKKKCKHPCLRQFTFTDGQTIKMCPDCTEFDAHRHSGLCREVPRVEEKE